MASEERPVTGTQSTKDMIPVGDKGLDIRTLDDMYRFAQFVATSNLAPKEMNTAGILVAIQMGAELGLPPMASVQNIAVINGRPSIWGDAALAVCQQHPNYLDIDEEWDEATQTATCKVYTVKRGMERPIVRTWSRKDNEVAGLEGGNVHKKFPKRMKQMRARSFALRDTFPGALRGLLTAEEAMELPPVKMVENEEGRQTLDSLLGTPSVPVEVEAPVLAVVQPEVEVEPAAKDEEGPMPPDEPEQVITSEDLVTMAKMKKLKGGQFYSLLDNHGAEAGDMAMMTNAQRRAAYEEIAAL